MSAKSRRRQAAELLEFFYPVHYQVNMVLEDAMRGSLTRKEAAVLWMLHAEGGSDASLPRKVVAERLHGWFDATSSNVTKIIARLAGPRLALVRVFNEPGSARDKRIGLSDNGRALLRKMLKSGEDCSEQLLAHLSDEQIRTGIAFLRAASASADSSLPLKKFALKTPLRK